MVPFRNGFAAPIVFVTSVGLVIATSGAIAHSNESNCRRLEDLARQYAGVQLTSQQQKLKRRLIAWYNGNCKRMRSADVRGLTTATDRTPSTWGVFCQNICPDDRFLGVPIRVIR